MEQSWVKQEQGGERQIGRLNSADEVLKSSYGISRYLGAILMLPSMTSYWA